LHTSRVSNHIPPWYNVYIMSTYYVVVATIIAFVVALGSVVLYMLLSGKRKTRVPYLPICTELLPHIAGMLDLNRESILYDLGSGDSRVLRYCIDKYPYLRAVGVEWALLPHTIARLWNMIHPRRNLRLLHGNFFHISISECTHLFIYLLPEVMNELLPKLKAELSAETRIISCDFKFDAIEPIESREIFVGKRMYTLYAYSLRTSI